MAETLFLKHPDSTPSRSSVSRKVLIWKGNQHSTKSPRTASTSTVAFFSVWTSLNFFISLFLSTCMIRTVQKSFMVLNTNMGELRSSVQLQITRLYSLAQRTPRIRPMDMVFTSASLFQLSLVTTQQRRVTCRLSYTVTYGKGSSSGTFQMSSFWPSALLLRTWRAHVSSLGFAICSLEPHAYHQSHLVSIVKTSVLENPRNPGGCLARQYT